MLFQNGYATDSFSKRFVWKNLQITDSAVSRTTYIKTISKVWDHVNKHTSVSSCNDLILQQKGFRNKTNLAWTVSNHGNIWDNEWSSNKLVLCFCEKCPTNFCCKQLNLQKKSVGQNRIYEYSFPPPNYASSYGPADVTSNCPSWIRHHWSPDYIEDISGIDGTKCVVLMEQNAWYWRNIVHGIAEYSGIEGTRIGFRNIDSRNVRLRSSVVRVQKSRGFESHRSLNDDFLLSMSGKLGKVHKTKLHSGAGCIKM